MRSKFHDCFIVLALLAGITQAPAQLPVITSFSQNGVLVCSNLAPGSVASVQWASSLSGPWQTNWAGLTAVTAGTNGSIQVSVPMFYRVLGVAYNPPITQRHGAHSGGVVHDGGHSGWRERCHPHQRDVCRRFTWT